MTMPQLAVVVWHDHHCSDQPISRAAAALLKPMRRMASGWVLAETEHGITLAMDVATEDPDEGDPHLFIGRDMIEAVIWAQWKPDPMAVELVDDD
jgi:hypothetical protein